MKTQLNLAILFASFTAAQVATANDDTNTSASVKEIYGIDVKETLTKDQSVRVYLDEYAHLNYLTLTGQDFSPWLRSAYARIERTDLSALATDKHTTTLFDGVGFDMNFNEKGISVTQTSSDFDKTEVTITRDYTYKAALGYDEDPTDVKPSTEFGPSLSVGTIIMKAPLMVGKTVDGIDVALLVADANTPAQATVSLYTSKEDAINARLPLREENVQATEDGWQRALFAKPVSVLEEANDNLQFYVRVDFENAHMPEVGGEVNGTFFMPNDRSFTNDTITLSKDYGISLLAGEVNVRASVPETGNSPAANGQDPAAGSFGSLMLSLLGLTLLRRRQA